MEIHVAYEGPSDREDSIRMVAESAAGLLTDDRSRARSLRFANARFDASKWADMSGMGWLMLRVPAELDGLGMGLSELCAIARALGSELSPEPVARAAVIAPALPDGARDAVLAGTEIILPAFARYGQAAPGLRDGCLTGTVEAVPMAGHANAFLVQTDTGAALIRANAPGLHLTLQETHDGGHVGQLRFAQATAEGVGADLGRLREEAAIVLSAQLLGMAETAFQITLAYLKDRKQFGSPIGAFQALQHRAVDLYLELSLARAAVDAAAEQADDGAADAVIALHASLAKARATRAAQIVTQAAVQLHGGIGYTDEADIGLYLRKVMTLSGLLGTERFHRDRALVLGESAA